MKLFRFIACLAFALPALSGGAAKAQSTDPAAPTPVTSGVISGKGNGGVVSYYYQAAAGPGELSVGFRARTTAYAETVLAEVLDGDKKLLRLDLSADSDGPQSSGKISLSSRRTLLIHVLSKPRIATFQVTLSGPLHLPATQAEPVTDSTQGAKRSSSGDTHARATNSRAADAAKWLPCIGTDAGLPVQIGADGRLLGLENCGYVRLEMQDGSSQEIPVGKIKRIIVHR